MSESRPNPSEEELRELKIARLLGEFADRLAEGQPADIAAFLREHPDVSTELEGDLRLLRVVGAVADDTVPKPRFGDFQVMREIERGGMGIVYEAIQVSLDRRVALKVLPSALLADRRTVARFYREAKVAASLRHDHIVPVFALGVENDTPYFAMELCEGETLRQALRRIGSFSPSEGVASIDTLLFGPVSGARPSPIDRRPTPQSPLIHANAQASGLGGHRRGQARTDVEYCLYVAGLFAGAAEGLQHAHDCKVIHRDIKPSNLILDLNGRLRLLDFGLAWVADDQNLTLPNDRLGTPLYMSPEQVSGGRDNVGFATDIYSLGATLYEVLTWQPPFVAEDQHEVLYQIVHTDPGPPRRINPAIPDDLEIVVLKCLRKDPRDRFGTAEALAQELRRVERRAPIESRRQTLLERFRRKAWQSKRRIAGGTVLAVLVLLLAILAGRQWNAAERLRLGAYNDKVTTAAELLLRQVLRSPVVELAKAQAEVRPIDIEDEAPIRRSPEPGGLTVLMRAGCELVDPPDPGPLVPGAAAASAAEDLELARKLLEDAAQILPARSEAHYYLARVLDQQGQTDEALARAEKLTRMAPEFVPGVSLRAHLSRKLGYHDAALRLTEEASGAAKGTWAQRWLEAQRAMEGGRWDAAAGACEALLALDGEGFGPYVGWELEALVGAGMASVRRQDFAKAIERLGTARSKYGASLEIDLLLAKIYEKSGSERDAVSSDELLDHRLMTAPQADKERIATAAVEAYLEIGELRKAREWVNRVPKGAMRTHLKGRFLRSMGRVGLPDDLQAMLDAQELVQVIGNEPWIHLCHGNAHLSLRLFSDAESAFNKARALAPGEAGPFVGLGIASFGQGKLGDARDFFTTALGLDARSIQARYNLGVVLMDQDMAVEAENQFVQVLSLEPDHALSLNNLGILFDKKALLAEATQLYGRAVRAAPRLDLLRYNFGRALQRQGEHRMAAAEFREAVKLGCTDAVVHKNLALSLFHLHEFPQALIEYKIASRLDPDCGITQHGLGATLINLYRYVEAVEPLQRAVAAQPQWVDARSDYALVLERSDRKDEALKEYFSCVKLQPDFIHAFNNLSHLLLREKLPLPSRPELLELLPLLEDARYLPGAHRGIDALIAKSRESLQSELVTYPSIDEYLDAPEALVDQGASWKHWRGTGEPTDDLWTATDFADAGWPEGRSGFAMEEGEGIRSRLESDGSCASLYLRRRFTVVDRSRFKEVLLQVRSSGGWVAYLNGIEQARLFARSPRSYIAPDTCAERDDSPWVMREVKLSADTVVDGENVLAIRALSPPLQSSQTLWIEPMLMAVPHFENGGGERAARALESGAAYWLPETGMSSYFEAAVKEREGDYPEAERLYRHARAHEVNRCEPTVRLAACLRAQGRVLEAVKILREGLDVSRTSHLERFRLWLEWSLGDLALSCEQVLDDLGPLPEDVLGIVNHSLWALREIADAGQLRINCGGLDYEGQDGRVWSKDKLHLGGYSFTLFRLREAEAETDPRSSPLYETERYYPEPADVVHGYRIPLPRGTYRVTLHFVEGHFRNPGSRSFDVLVEGSLTEDVEPLRAGFGVLTTLEELTEIKDGALNIDFRRRVENPKISAIELEKI
jgi:serine/threonine protein kinase/tetratricopeptide (TPR) repeat protein